MSIMNIWQSRLNSTYPLCALITMAGLFALSLSLHLFIALI